MASALSSSMRSLRARPSSSVPLFATATSTSCDCFLSHYTSPSSISQQLRSFHISKPTHLTSQQRLPQTKKFLRRSAAWEPAPARSAPIALVSPQTGLPLTNLPYFVRRTASNQLPVYTDTKAGGTLQQTKVQKIEGNVEALKEQLACELGIEPKSGDIAVNHLTGHVVVKGWRRPQIQKFLLERGF
ncbi:Ribosomal protein L49/IMG2 [Ascosphaera apis ARSEF 7405]|uniref:Large ribosomal subunit protein mL49 n=1 Tax=Ascosphaera apis ARSEF 7405 TaxID=392613 RepID=A0A167UY25_9EURO|nr:Ribosomal protein L49/IMG2 [Ascosphaera apis ARSEF 7405]